jgi:hypothetical protein
MATIDSAVCIEELIQQCEMALEAIGQLNYTLMNLYQVPFGGSRYDTFKNEVFEIIYTFLGSASYISELLWPDAADRKRVFQVNFPDAKGIPAQGSVPRSTVQRTFGTTKRRFLKILKRTRPSQLALRNEIWKQLRALGACHIIGSPIAVTEYPSPVEMRIYDPTTRDFHMDGEIYPLQEIAAAIARLQACARGEEKIPASILPADSQHHFDNKRQAVRKTARL